MNAGCVVQGVGLSFVDCILVMVMGWVVNMFVFCFVCVLFWLFFYFGFATDIHKIDQSQSNTKGGYIGTVKQRQ